MEEFALCWNNFATNIATGFQNLYVRGDLVDVTLACDGKLIHAHKIVLAICSPYFQEMFNTNPCKHPIIILKDVTYSVMTELLQFMYQGEVNVKHTELPTFMKIAETLQIKGLTTSAANVVHHKGASSPNGEGGSSMNQHKFTSSSSNAESETSTPPVTSQKRTAVDFRDDCSYTPSYSKRRQLQPPHRLLAVDMIDNQDEAGADLNTATSDSASEHQNAPGADDHDMSSMVDGGNSRYDLVNVKRETGDLGPNSPLAAVLGGRVTGSIVSPFNFDYGGIGIGNNSNSAGNSSGLAICKYDYRNDLQLKSDHFSKAGNHMDIPAGANVTMLSSTSLLHGNCVFNRNNTVATQQGMKTYWLCKSYRVSMCRARCITHQGRIISATGVHNHSQHIKGGQGSVSNPNHPPAQAQQALLGPHQTTVTSQTTATTTITPTSMANPAAASDPKQQQQQQQQQVTAISIPTIVSSLSMDTPPSSTTIAGSCHSAATVSTPTHNTLHSVATSQSGVVANPIANSSNNSNMNNCSQLPTVTNSVPLCSNSTSDGQMQQQQQQHVNQMTVQLQHHQSMQHQHQVSSLGAAAQGAVPVSLHNMMQTVLNPNNLMHLTNIAPIVSTHQSPVLVTHLPPPQAQNHHLAHQHQHQHSTAQLNLHPIHLIATQSDDQQLQHHTILHQNNHNSHSHAALLHQQQHTRHIGSQPLSSPQQQQHLSLSNNNNNNSNNINNNNNLGGSNGTGPESGVSNHMSSQMRISP